MPLTALAAAIALFAQFAAAQQIAEGGTRRALSVVPYASVAATVTDNVHLTDADKKSDVMLALTAGVRISGEGSRVKGFLNYGLTGQTYADGSKASTFQNSLNTFGSVEAIDNLAFLDFSGSIARQAVSAFGVQADRSGIPNANQSEVSTFRLSPYVRGRLAGSANYEARYTWTTTRTGTASASDAKVADALVKLDGRIPSSQLAWLVEASRQSVDFTAGRSTEADRLAGTLSYPVSNQLVVSMTGGRDSNNYTNAGKESHSVVGVGVNWSPAPTTTLSANASNQSFGQGHSLSFEHRTPRTVWRVSDFRGVATTPGQLISTSVGSIYDLYFSQFASTEPDPIKRAQLVTNFLQTNGLNPNTPVIAGYLTSAVLLQRRQDASFALLGVRGTLTFLASRSNNRRLDTLSGAADDLLNSSAITQQGFSVSYAHRLTPDTGLNAIASQQRTQGSATQPETSLRTLSLNVTSRVGRQSTASFGARRSAFDSPTVPYTESALTGSLTVQF
ncbi:TIGR03016 family PEP-CTERM system-associated outer membrane protein [Rhodoferax sp.]|uniref:TIGR03016 family PEP-CTERM system-associated outer membrane protein n=1 Tax=Rhodoferax sp. TaxID=50421 RepID=UPI00274884DD|nr:TIGR03016 family PEP-CTERM system-associated outer membrane protein [Rhodoferax sp.]